MSEGGRPACLTPRACCAANGRIGLKAPRAAAGGALTAHRPRRRFVAEGLPGPHALLPEGAFERARARLVIERFCSKAVPEFYKLLLRQVRALRLGWVHARLALCHCGHLALGTIEVCAALQRPGAGAAHATRPPPPRAPQDPSEQAAAAVALGAQLEWLAREGLDATGPWALGAGGPSLVDCAVVPFILRLVRVCGGGGACARV